MVCDICWNAAYIRMLAKPWKSQAEHYQDLMNEHPQGYKHPEQEEYK